MTRAAKTFTRFLPEFVRRELKRKYYAFQVRRGTFRSPEPEFLLLKDFIDSGDFVIDIGANVGHYTLAMSALVGPTGRVVAWEPVPETFELLAANCGAGNCRNVTLINAAATDAPGTLSMEMPKWSSGETNYYEARVAEGCGGVKVLGLPVNLVRFLQPAKLIKIDVEGHEQQVIAGLKELIQRDRPLMIVEGSRANSDLESMGYTSTRNGASPNHVWSCKDNSHGQNRIGSN